MRAQDKNWDFTIIADKVSQRNWHPRGYTDKEPARNREILLVTKESPIPQRQIVERFARYFKMEMDYEKQQYFITDEDDYKAFLFSLEGYWVGASVFRKREGEYRLQWIWMHPFARRRGLLRDNWMKWESYFGKFKIEGPISNDMRNFLQRQGVTMARIWLPEEKSVLVGARA